jgi:mannitol-1-phosphate 5-dehydrogenase
MHNMSHAAAAYFGYVAEPAAKYLWQVMKNQAVVSRVRLCLDESAAALAGVYPLEFNVAELLEHGHDLLARYRNQALGDTLHRVGRDLGRKLARDDRLIGACLLAAEAGLPYQHLAAAAAAALVFRAPDEQGQLLPADAQFVARLGSEGSRAILLATSKLNLSKPHEAAVLETILLAKEQLGTILLP